MKNILFEGGNQQTQRKKRNIFYCICATLVILLIMLIAFIALAIVQGLTDESENGKNENIVSIGETTVATFEEGQLYIGNLLLLDKNHTYKGTPDVESMQTYKDRPKKSDGKNTYTVYNQNTSLCLGSEALAAFNKMAADFYSQKKNDNLIVFNAYDTSDNEQDAVFTAGTAVALGYWGENAEPTFGISKKGDFAWIYNNAAKYGFVNISAEGSSTVFRYVGKEHATAMKTNGWSFAEYLDHLKANTTPEKPLSVTASGEVYAIYYLPNTGILTVPKNTYTVSGNNVDGYIISTKAVISEE